MGSDRAKNALVHEFLRISRKNVILAPIFGLRDRRACLLGPSVWIRSIHLEIDRHIKNKRAPVRGRTVEAIKNGLFFQTSPEFWIDRLLQTTTQRVLEGI